MSPTDPDEAEFELTVENRYLRRLVTFIRKNRSLSGFLIAGFGILFSLGSLVTPYLVIPDIIIDIFAAFLGVTFIRRVVTAETKPVEVSASTLEMQVETEPAEESGSNESG